MSPESVMATYSNNISHKESQLFQYKFTCLSFDKCGLPAEHYWAAFKHFKTTFSTRTFTPAQRKFAVTASSNSPASLDLRFCTSFVHSGTSSTTFFSVDLGSNTANNGRKTNLDSQTGPSQQSASKCDAGHKGVSF